MSSEIALDETKQEEFTKKIKNLRRKSKTRRNTTRGVVYLGHIPDGFVEPDMREYFGQFGRVTRLRLARSRKTGGSRGFAFVEFEYEEVAKVVAETMNNYLMHEKLLQCRLLRRDEVRDDLFKGWKLGQDLAYEKNRRRQNTWKSELSQERQHSKRLRRMHWSKKKLAKLGITYEFPKVSVCGSASKRDSLSEQKIEDSPADNLSGSSLVEDSPADNLSGSSLVEDSPADNLSGFSLVVDSSEAEVSFKTPHNVRIRKTKKIKTEKPTKEGKISLKKAKIAGKNKRKHIVQNDTL